MILHHLFPFPGRVKMSLIPARILQRLGALGLMERVGLYKLLPPTLRRLQAMLPTLADASHVSHTPYPPIGPKRAKVALFLGCVSDALTPEVTRATIRVLQRNGCEVVVPRGQGCCGAIHYHSGVEEPALALARRNLDAFNPAHFDAIIINVAGCGAMLKDYAHLLQGPDHDRAAAFVAKVRDISEFLVELGPIPPKHGLGHKNRDLRVTYHDACHLCHAQQIRSEPRRLLAMIPGVSLEPLEESELCCGAAGTYNLTEPEMSERLGRRKMDRIEATGAEVVATGNIGCILQIARQAKQRENPIEVVHPVVLLDRAYEGSESNA